MPEPFHAKMQTHLCKDFFDLVERLATEVRSAKHFRFRLLDKIADINNIVVLQAVCRTDRQFQLVYFLQ